MVNLMKINVFVLLLTGSFENMDEKLNFPLQNFSF